MSALLPVQRRKRGVRVGLVAEFLADLRHLDGQRRECGKKLATAVRASGTSLTGLFGAGPVIAGLILGDVRDVTGSEAGTTSPPTTAPPPSRCPPTAGRSTG